MAKPSAKPDDCRGIIVGPGVNQPDPFPRFFTRQRDGSFTAAPGDSGKLTFAGGSYRLTEVDQTIWQFRSDKLLDYVQDANANRVTLAYTDGRLTRLTHSADKQLLIDYNAAGRIWHVTDTASPGAADDRVTTYEYDLSGEHLLRIIAPGDRVTEYAYEIGGSLPRKYALTSVQFADGTHDFFV
jgi:YD repeat-containing protein